MTLPAEMVQKACKLLCEVSPQTVNIIREDPNHLLGIMFRNCVVTVYSNADGECEKIYTEMQYMEDWRKEKFLSESQKIPGTFILELEQEITRFGFKD